MIAARNTLGEGRAAMVNETKVHPSIYSGNDDAEAFFDRMAEMFPAPDRLKKLEREVDSLTGASLSCLRDSISFRLEAEAAAARLARLRAANRGQS